MIVRSFLKAVEQLLDPKFRKVLIIGCTLALLVFVGLMAGVLVLKPEDVALTGYDWIDSALSWLLGFTVWPVFIFTMWFMFPAVATVFMGFFLDDVVDAVEERHYPQQKASSRLGFGRSTYLALRMGLWVLLLNIAAIPFYIVLLFTAIGPLILFFLLNSYLIGREYFELVAARHLSDHGSKMARREIRDKVFLAGGLITAAFMVPGVNLLAPVVGAAMMTHHFHMSGVKNHHR